MAAKKGAKKNKIRDLPAKGGKVRRVSGQQAEKVKGGDGGGGSGMSALGSGGSKGTYTKPY